MQRKLKVTYAANDPWIRQSSVFSTCDNSMASKLLRVKLPSNLMEFYRRFYYTSTLQAYAKGEWLYRYHNSWDGTNRLLAIGICQKYGVPFDTTR